MVSFDWTIDGLLRNFALIFTAPNESDLDLLFVDKVFSFNNYINLNLCKHSKISLFE